jgi:NAD(P)-dependent dehydrogenase (short-subunit alcohol dehydrogenase family)
MHNETLSGKTYIVIGGNSGIGLSIAKELINSGAHVIIASRHIDNQSIVDTNVDYIKWDISDCASNEEIIGELLNHYSVIDGIVISAGINRIKSNFKHHSLEFMIDEINQVHQTNVIGVCHICNIFKQLAHQNKIKNFKIINIISAGGLTPVPQTYFTSKHALYSFTKAFAEENKDIIKTYGIAPGEVSTKMIRHKDFSLVSNLTLDRRKAHPDEIGKLAGFMMSDAGDLLYGNIVVVDGGATLIKNYI